MGERIERHRQCDMPHSGYHLMDRKLPDPPSSLASPGAWLPQPGRKGVLCQQIAESGLLGEFQEALLGGEVGSGRQRSEGQFLGGSPVRQTSQAGLSLVTQDFWEKAGYAGESICPLRIGFRL